MYEEERFHREQVDVNKAILYAALLSSAGFFLAYWPPDHLPDSGLLLIPWYAVLIIAIAISLRVAWLLYRLEF